MKFGAHIHVPQRMNPTDFSDPLTFPSSATIGFKFVLLREMSRQLLDGLS